MELSRRSFLAGAALTAAGGMAGLGLSGCQNQAMEGSASSGSSPEGGGSSVGYEVVNSDLLIIGGGFGAMSAAFEAVAKGKTVTIVDKGPYRASGACGYNWDAVATWSPDQSQFPPSEPESYIINWDLATKANDSNPNVDVFTTLVNRGQCLPDRKEDGTPNWYIDLPMMKGIGSVYTRHDQDAIANSQLVAIDDQTMVTDVFVNDGRCLGAIALHLPTGKVRVYRSDATILASGGCGWLYGWMTVSARTVNSPDNTADVEMAAFRHGAPIGDAEHAAYDCMSVVPTAIAFSHNAGCAADANEFTYITDKDGNYFLMDEQYDQERFLSDRAYFNQILGKTIAEGKGSPNGGVYIDLSDPEIIENLRIDDKRNQFIWEAFGMDFKESLVEAAPEMYEHGGAPVVDDRLMVEGIEGLFCVRGAGIYGAGGGSTLCANGRYGSYAVRSALEYLEATELSGDIDWTPVEEECARLDEMRTREDGEGIRPHAIRHEIQAACENALGVYCEREKMQAALDELINIRAEKLPHQIVSNKTLTYNIDWKQAIENYNLLDLAELSVRARLTREETRGQYLYADFPEQDDDNWACMLAWSHNDGNFEYEKRELPTLEEARQK